MTRLKALPLLDITLAQGKREERKEKEISSVPPSLLFSPLEVMLCFLRFIYFFRCVMFESFFLHSSSSSLVSMNSGINRREGERNMEEKWEAKGDRDG